MRNKFKTLMCILMLQQNAIDTHFWDTKANTWFDQIESNEKNPGKKRRKLRLNRSKFFNTFNAKTANKNEIHTYAYYVVDYAKTICKETLELENKLGMLEQLAPQAIKLAVKNLENEILKPHYYAANPTATDSLESDVINKILFEMKKSSLKIKSEALLKIMAKMIINKIDNSIAFNKLNNLINAIINNVISSSNEILKRNLLDKNPSADQLQQYFSYSCAEFDVNLEKVTTLSDQDIQTCLPIAQQNKNAATVLNNLSSLKETDAKVYKFKHNNKTCLVIVYMPNSAFQKAQIITDQTDNPISKMFKIFKSHDFLDKITNSSLSTSSSVKTTASHEFTNHTAQ